MTKMRFIDEFRTPDVVRSLTRQLHSFPRPAETYSFMEVCGTHTMAIFRFGIRQILPTWVRLISGPGCPVCVTADDYIARACAIALQHQAIIATFGDLMPVPGAGFSLEQARAEGADVRVVYTPHDCIDICRRNPDREVVYLAVGFETTAPISAALVLEAQQKKIANFSLLVAHKLIPPAMNALLSDPDLKLDGFICPPHVSAIIGAQAFEFIPQTWAKPCVIAGFESTDIMRGLNNLVEQILNKQNHVANVYRRVVKYSGNTHARKMLYSVFESATATWRGIGQIPDSGLVLKSEYSSFDAARRFEVKLPPLKPSKCRCGDVLRGIITPKECSLFATACHPENPIGPCMVSSEGTCSAYYKYDR
ncbi:hydrogenase formation protein HypD [candidate division CSSED10-310 bacterium]|uniref:Hydrogenase formation protein HypD n=1 Tax=candidate division CSSED10-310 bacterium TaxID=2855610 RepID=A0ABV6YWI3_UNCC1